MIKLRAWIMGKYHLMHNVVGFVCNLHEFIKHLSAIFLFLLLREIEIYGQVFLWCHNLSLDNSRAISPSKDYKKTNDNEWSERDFSTLQVFIPLSLMTFYGKVFLCFFWRFVMYVNELLKDATRVDDDENSWTAWNENYKMCF